MWEDPIEQNYYREEYQKAERIEYHSLLGFGSGLRYEPRAQLPEAIEGDEHQQKGERIAGRSDDGREDHQDDNRVTTEFGEECPCDQSHLAEQPAE